MRSIFFHDTKLINKNQILYSTGGFNKSKVDEYLKFCSGIVLATRVKVMDNDTDGLVLVSTINERVELLSIDDLTNFSFTNYIKAFKKINSRLDNVDVSIVRLPSIIGLLGYLLSKIKNKIIILEVVGCPWDSYYYYGGLKAKIVAPIMFILTKIATYYSKNTIYVTDDFLQKRYPSKHKNTLGCSDVVIELSHNILSQRLKNIDTLDERKIRIGIIGALSSKYKGFDVLFKCINILDKKEPGKYELEVVGGGSDRSVRKLIEFYNIDHLVRIVGSLSHPLGVNMWLDSIDIYVQPSKTEGLSRAVIEAMSRGCACIGSNVGGMPELLDTRFLHQKDDSEGFASIINSVSNKVDLTSQCKVNISKCEKFNPDTLSRHRSTFYKKSLKK
jgi:glycosyltransferase involved in cell wall biosynthesis